MRPRRPRSQGKTRDVLLQHFQLQFLEAYFQRAAAVHLQAEDAAARQLVVLIVGTQVTVDPDADAAADGLDNVVVPLVGLDELLAAVLG